MSFRITARTEAGSMTYSAIGSRDELLDAAYDAGALGVTLMVIE